MAKYFAGRFLVIDDALRPRRHLVPEKRVMDIPPKIGVCVDWKTGKRKGDDELHRFLNREFQKARATARKVRGVAPGAMFQVPVADGAAWYVVTMVRGKNAKIEVRYFSGDRYRDHHFSTGGWFSKDELAPYVQVERAAQKLFAARTP
jgi:hypothetical protein